MKYMIHACPARMWYVKEFLIPQMIEQGIAKKSIIVWNDTNRLGCLESCMQAFESLDGDGATWHIQDDVILCRDFAKRTAEYDGVVYGFCSPYFQDDTSICGTVYAEDMWNSFQCVRIPDKIAQECAEWFRTEGQKQTYLIPLIRANKGDDSVFHEFFLTHYGREMVTNAKPNLVDHVDWLIGGSVVNEWRGFMVRATHFKDSDLVEELETKIRNRV